MDKERIIEVLSDWNFWSKDIETGLLRQPYVQALERLQHTGQIVVVTGVRRAGKSTLLKQYMRQLIDQGLDRKNLLYINFEEPKFADELSLAFLERIYEAYREIVVPTGKPYLFLDEVQLIPRWEKFARALQEKKEALVVVSGSSAKLLSKEFATVLTGRHVDIVVYPLRFNEFLQFKGWPLTSKLDFLSQSVTIRRLLREYLEYGGFPLVVLQEEKKEILWRYFEDIITKDIVERYHIKKIAELKSLARQYLADIGSLISFRRLHHSLGLSLDSVERYSSYLTTAYLFGFVPKFSYKVREQEVNPRKVYCIDNGLRNVVGFRFSDDLGKLYENTVYLELSKNQAEIYYGRAEGECDFLIKEGRKITTAIQVCYQLTDSNKPREIQGLLAALKTYQLYSGLIITENYDAEEMIAGKKITYLPLWRWLLSLTEPVRPA